jgi:hypothetical protein
MSHCPRCERKICSCGLQGYIAVPLPLKFHPGFDGHQTIDDAEGNRLCIALTAVVNRWFENGLDEFDVIDALNDIAARKKS